MFVQYFQVEENGFFMLFVVISELTISLVRRRSFFFFVLFVVVFSFQNNPKNLDPSYKTDLDFVIV